MKHAAFCFQQISETSLKLTFKNSPSAISVLALQKWPFFTHGRMFRPSKWRSHGISMSFHPSRGRHWPSHHPKTKAELFDATVLTGFWRFGPLLLQGSMAFLVGKPSHHVCVCVRACMYISVSVYVYIQKIYIASYICTTLNTLDNMTSVEREVLSVISTSRSTVS